MEPKIHAISGFEQMRDEDEEIDHYFVTWAFDLEVFE